MDTTVLCCSHHPGHNAEENEVAVAGLVEGRDLLLAAAALHQLQHRQRGFADSHQILQAQPGNSEATVLERQVKRRKVRTNKCLCYRGSKVQSSHAYHNSQHPVCVKGFYKAFKAAVLMKNKSKNTAEFTHL